MCNHSTLHKVCNTLRNSKPLMVNNHPQVEACRARLYVMESKALDEETPQPTAAWKKACKSCILPKVTK